MKKTLLLGAALMTGALGFAQSAGYKAQTKLPAAIANKTELYNPIMAGSESVIQAPTIDPNPYVTAQRGGLPEFVVGMTTYDLQSNSSVQNRILNHGGSVSLLWTGSQSGTLASPDRGAWYNYYNGTSWMSQPTGRIEPYRTGWPSIFKTTAKEENVITHQSGTSALGYVSRVNKGTGTWTADSIIGLTTGEYTLWPRALMGGANNNTIHMISLTTPTGNGGTMYKGMDGVVVYSRSQDGGTTWDKQYEVPPGMDSTLYYNNAGDSYALDARGDVVAFVSGGFTQDLAMWKSTDNGNTWTKTILIPFPIPAYNPNGNILDTTWTDDGANAILIDNNNKVHVWAGRMRVIKTDSAATGVSYYPGTDGLLYWNETMGASAPIIIAEAEDRNSNGTLDIEPAIARYFKSLTSFPSAGIDASGNIFLVYSSIMENTSNGATVDPQSYRNVYGMALPAGSSTWRTPVNISNSDFDEGVFASLARHVDSHMHIIYQRDPEPGLAVRGDMDPFGPNEMVYVNYPAQLVAGVKAIQPSVKSVSIYPNPANNNAILSFNMVKAGKVTVEILNVLGQQMFSTQNEYSNGIHTMSVDITNLSAGLYIVNTASGNQKISQKLIVR
jgi:hypothetical protein